MIATGIGIQIGSLLLPYYGLMVLVGICTGVLVGYLQCRRFGLAFEDFALICCIGALGGVLGAKLLYLMVSWNLLDKSRLLEWRYLRSLLEAGFVFYGGLIGGLGGLVFCKRKLGLDVEGMLQVTIPCLPLAHGFGRIGCSLVGCCHGVPHQGFPHITYSDSWFAPNQVELFPVQPIEALALFLLAGVLLLLINRFHNPHGVSIYLISYALIRFVLEFWRGDGMRGFLGPLSTSQWISLVVLVAGVLLFCTWDRKVPLRGTGEKSLT